MKRRLIIAFTSITAFTLLIVVIPLGITLGRYQETKLKQDLLSDAQVLGNLVEDKLELHDSTQLQQIALNYFKRTEARVVIVDKSGALLADSSVPQIAARSFISRPEIESALQGKQTMGIRRSQTLNGGLVYATVPVGSGGKVFGAVRVTYSSTELDSRVRKQWLALGALCAVSMALVAFTGFILARWITRPIARVAATAHELGQGDLQQRAEVTGPPEIRELAQTLNATAARLGSVIDAQQSFVADVSHQLRTPLTALRLRVDNLADAVDTDSADVSGEVMKIRSDIARMSRIVDSLLSLARLDLRDNSGVETFPIAALLQSLVDTFAPVAHERHISLNIEGSENLRANRDRVEQVVTNLVANALDASPDNSTITLAVNKDDDKVVIHVIDSGAGMNGSITRSDSHRLGGLGLGLTIARRLAAIDKGEVAFASVEPNGTDASVSYPKP